MKTLKASKEFAVGKNGIVWIGSNFREHFGSMSFEESKELLVSKTLERSMLDSEILSELKPEEVTLGDVLHGLKTLDKSGWHIFYVRDAQNALWAVRAGWYSDGDGWNVGARSVSDPLRWLAGDQVLSRRFSEPLSSSDPLILRRLESLESWAKSIGYKGV